MMTENISLADKPTTLGQNLAYACSEIACNPIYTIIVSFLVYFYTDIIGIDAGIVGTIILVSKIFDGISDIIAGNIIDHTHTKAGSARPWFLWLAVPVALSYVILFTVPNCGTIGRILYIFISYNLVSTVIYTMMNAAMGALPTFMTRNRDSRSVMMSIRFLVAGLVQLGLMLTILPLVEKLGGGQSGWIKAAAILGTVSLVVLLSVYAIAKETTNEDGAAEDNDVPLWTAIKVLLQNKYWIMGLLMYFFGILIQVATLTVGVYYSKYVLNDVNMQTNMTLYYFLPALIIMFVLPFVLKNGISKRKMCFASAFILIIGSLLSMIDAGGIFFIIGLGLRGIGFGVLSSLLPGMMLETIVYGEWKTGYSIPGVSVTALGVGQKVGSGIGTALMGLVLAACGYDGLAATQPASAVRAIDFIYIFVPAIMAVVLIIILYFYKLDYEYPRYVKEVEERRARKAMR